MFPVELPPPMVNKPVSKEGRGGKDDIPAEVARLPAKGSLGRTVSRRASFAMTTAETIVVGISGRAPKCDLSDSLTSQST